MKSKTLFQFQLFAGVVLASIILTACGTPPTEMICPINVAAIPEGGNKECYLYEGGTPADTYQKVPALVLGPNEVGVYAGLSQDQAPQIFTNIGYNLAPAPYSFIYPSGVRDLFTADSCPDDPKGYRECIGPLDDLVFAGGIPGMMNINAEAQLAPVSKSNAQLLIDVGGYANLVGLLWGEVRSYRTESSGIVPDVTDINKTTQELEELYNSRLKEWEYYDLFPVHIEIRSLIIGDKAYQETLAELRAKQAAAEQEGALLDQLLKNEKSRQQLEAERARFAREQSLNDANSFAAQVQAICKGLENEQVCIDLAWIYVTGKEVRPVLTESGELTSQQVVAPTAAP